MTGSVVSTGFSASGAGENLEATMHRADVAMYAAKNLGGNRALPFDASLDGTLAASLRGKREAMPATSG